jgi:hypothetical protein
MWIRRASLRRLLIAFCGGGTTPARLPCPTVRWTICLPSGPHCCYSRSTYRTILMHTTTFFTTWFYFSHSSPKAVE